MVRRRAWMRSGSTGPRFQPDTRAFHRFSRYPSTWGAHPGLRRRASRLRGSTGPAGQRGRVNALQRALLHMSNVRVPMVAQLGLVARIEEQAEF